MFNLLLVRYKLSVAADSSSSGLRMKLMAAMIASVSLVSTLWAQSEEIETDADTKRQPDGGSSP
jgi:hypothetical protein